MSSSGIPAGTVPVTDEIYSVAEGAVQIDASTARRDMQVTPPTTPAIAPYNDGGKTLKFNVSGGTDRIRLDTTALRLSFGFYGTNTGTACNADPDTPMFSVPWNLWATMISAISLKINGNTVIYESSGGDYVHGLSARMFREYSAETLNGMDSVFFTPVTGDETYVAAVATNAGTAFPAAANERAARWIGENSHQKVVTKIIPFSVLFPPAICAVLKNLQSYELSITFINQVRGNWVAHAAIADANIQIGLLEQHAFGVNALGMPQALVHINNCDIIQDRYTPSAMLTVQQTAQKMPGEGGSDVERLAYYDVQVIDHTYQSSGTIQCGSTSNLDAVCIMQPCVYGYARTPTWRGNGQADPANRGILTSSGQYLFGNSCTADAAEAKRQADDTVGDGFMSVQLQYGTLTYPTLPIEIRGSGAATTSDFALLHQAYLRGVAKSTRKDVTPAIRYADFRRTMVFTFLRPWSDNAPHLNNSATDLTIRLPGGNAATTSIFIILFQVGMTDLKSDGSIYRFKSVS